MKFGEAPSEAPGSLTRFLLTKSLWVVALSHFESMVIWRPWSPSSRFEPFSREEDLVFLKDEQYGIVSILAMLDNEELPHHLEEDVIDQIDVLSALLEDTLQIPKIHMLVLPEMVDELPIDELPALFSFSPQAMTPIGALLTVANVEANALVTPDLPTARRLNF